TLYFLLHSDPRPRLNSTRPLSPRPFLITTKVNQSCNFAAQVFALHDEIDETFFLQEFAALESLRQLHLDRIPDRPWPSEADQRLGLRNDKIPQHCEARCHSTRRRVGQ